PYLEPLRLTGNRAQRLHIPGRLRLPSHRRSGMTKRRSTQSGQALVESGLILFIFLVFLIGTFDFGQYLYFHQSLSERARAALRYGIINAADRTGIQNMAVYNDPAGTVNGATALLPDFNTGMVAVCLPGDSGCSK